MVFQSALISALRMAKEHGLDRDYSGSMYMQALRRCINNVDELA